VAVEEAGGRVISGRQDEHRGCWHVKIEPRKSISLCLLTASRE
jgi:hypothetical protein